PDNLPECGQELAPAAVTELGGDPRGVDDVQEQDGCEASARRSARHRLKYRRAHNAAHAAHLDSRKSTSPSEASSLLNVCEGTGRGTRSLRNADTAVYSGGGTVGGPSETSSMVRS